LLWVAVASAQAPPVSQADLAYERGLLAADQGAWGIALDNLLRAHAERPSDPRILYALGATHVKAGHALLGTLWLSAALRAAPQAENADRLREMIRRLQAEAFEEMQRVFAAAASAAQLLPDGEERATRLTVLLRTQAGAGDLDGARVTAAALRPAAPTTPAPAGGSAALPEAFWDSATRYHAAVGEFPQAEAALAHVGDAGLQTGLWVELSYHRIMTGNRAAATAALARAETSVQQMVQEDQAADADILDALVTLARGYAGNGQADAYRRLMAQAQGFAEDRDLSEDERAPLTRTEEEGLDRLRTDRAAPTDAAPRQWIALAERWENDGESTLDLPARLQQVKAQEGPGEMAEALTDIGNDYGRARVELLALETEYPETRPAPPAAASAPLPPLQIRAVCPPGTAGAENLPFAEAIRADAATTRTLCVASPVLLDQSAIKAARVLHAQGQPFFRVEITWTAAGRTRYEAVMREYLDEQIAVVSRGSVIAASRILTPPRGPTMEIAPLSEAEAKALVQAISAALAPASGPSKDGRPSGRSKP
jgi:hypothetical protein